MEIYFEQGNCILKNAPCMNLALTLDCGQAFRWRQTDNGCWHGAAFNKALTLRQECDRIILYDTAPEVYEKIWKGYFDFERDYDSILKRFSSDTLLGETVKRYYGIRILRQDSWEALFSFVFSSSNNIKRIRGFLEKLSAAFGDDLGGGDFAFPTPKQLAHLREADYRALGAGYRGAYLEDCVTKILNGEINLNELGAMPLEEARAELMKIKGVGPKVAECALLFGCGHLDAFPTDRWIKRVLSLYPDGLPECFRGYEGIAQQYMFHYARMHLGA